MIWNCFPKFDHIYIYCLENHACYDHQLASYEVYIPYSAKFWRGKTLANRSFQTFGEENVGELTIANNIISYFSESGIWLGKILANDVQFAKFAKVFPRQNFAPAIRGSYS